MKDQVRSVLATLDAMAGRERGFRAWLTRRFVTEAERDVRHVLSAMHARDREGLRVLAQMLGAVVDAVGATELCVLLARIEQAAEDAPLEDVVQLGAQLELQWRELRAGVEATQAEADEALVGSLS